MVTSFTALSLSSSILLLKKKRFWSLEGLARSHSLMSKLPGNTEAPEELECFQDPCYANILFLELHGNAHLESKM